MRKRASFVTAALLLSTQAASADVPHVTRPRGLDRGTPGAEQALRTYAPDFTFRARGEERFGDGERVLQYRAFYKNLPVFGANAAVRLDRTQAVRDVFHPTGAVDWPSTLTPAVSRAQARDTLAKYTRFELPASRLALGLYLRYGVARLAWFAYPLVPAALPTRPRLVLDAATGAMIQAVDRAHTATALMYPTNPVSSPSLETLALPLPESAPDTLAGRFLVAKNCVDRKSVKSTPFGFDLHLCDLEDSATADAAGNYVLMPNDDGGAEAMEDAFSQLSIYYHAARAIRFFQDLQGDPEAQVVRDVPLTAISNLRVPAGLMGGGGDPTDPETPLEPMPNAFFSPGGDGDLFAELLDVDGGGIYFGQGSIRDFAYDGDVVYHEFTHAVVDKTLALESFVIDDFGTSAAPSAMNEGLADYFSSAIAGDPMVGEYISAEGGGLEGALRSLANNAGCGDLGGESHHDGLGFSGALWAARTSAADGSKVDASLYKTMRSYAGSTTPGYEELFKLFVAGLAEDAPEAAARLDDELLARGFAPQCTRIREQRRGVAIEGPEELGGFYAPGTLYVGARVAPGVIQVHYKFSPGATLIVNVGGLFSQGSFFGDGEFKPRLVARYGQPISWMSDGRVRGVFDEEHKLFPDDSDARIILEVPADATDVYVQIVNHGEADGVYQTVLIEESGGTSSSSSGGASSGGSSSERPEYIDVYDDEGCGCHQAPSTGNGLLAAIAAFGIGLARRRRRAR